jgi:hypothetical protein
MHVKTSPAGFGAESPEALSYLAPKSSDLLFNRAVSSSLVFSILKPKTVCRISISPCRLKDLLGRNLFIIPALRAADKVFYCLLMISIADFGNEIIMAWV